MGVWSNRDMYMYHSKVWMAKNSGNELKGKGCFCLPEEASMYVICMIVVSQRGGLGYKKE